MAALVAGRSGGFARIWRVVREWSVAYALCGREVGESACLRSPVGGRSSCVSELTRAREVDEGRRTPDRDAGRLLPSRMCTCTPPKASLRRTSSWVVLFALPTASGA